MIKIELVKFEAQDVITISKLPVAAPEQPPVVEPPVEEPPVYNGPRCTCTVNDGIPQWALDIHGGNNGHGSCGYYGPDRHLCGK